MAARFHGYALPSIGEVIYSLVETLYPICRSITGNGVRETLRLIGQRIPLEVVEVPSGTNVFDWQVPKEWNVKAAHIRDSAGRTIVDFARHNLHLVSYSTPVHAQMTLEELRPHLHSRPDQPTWIPYRTSYYAPSWGFCMADEVLRSLKSDRYDVVVDSTLENGSLTYGEFLVRGQVRDEVLIYTHTCHPSMANDNASGMALATVLAEQLSRATPRLSYRFVFGPGTIGSITWLARNEARLDDIVYGLVLGLAGGPGGVSYKRSRHGNGLVDRAAAHVLGNLTDSRIHDFTPYGYDERQFCSPGIDLPVGRLTRSGEGAYAEYHSSADDLALVRPERLAETFGACSRILGILDREARYANLSPKGEPQLGRRGLYRRTGGEQLPGREYALLWVLNQSDGGQSLLGISERSGLPFESIADAADELEAAQLLRRIDARTEVPLRET